MKAGGLAAMLAGFRADVVNADNSTGAERDWILLDPTGGHTTLVGSVSGAGQYRIVAFGPSSAGDRWTIEDRRFLPGRPHIVALFDQNMNMLARTSNPRTNPLHCILRRDAITLFVGIAPRPDLGNNGDNYRLLVSRRAGADIPTPHPQTVLLNFAGGTGISVNSAQNVSFTPFDGFSIGVNYNDATEEIRAAIIATLRANYAGYGVQFRTSAPPAAQSALQSTIHFGGYSEAQLGLAERVDLDNARHDDDAIVFVDSFAPYALLRFSPEEMGRMIGNVASHELGHLLGLYHTLPPDSLMSEADSCTVWDMAGPQIFRVADLDPRVFPVGQLDVPQVLADTVGLVGD